MNGDIEKFQTVRIYSDPYKWAEDSGYRYEQLEMSNAHILPDAIGVPVKNEAFPAITEAYRRVRAVEQKHPIVIRATNINVLVWNWGGAESTRRHYRYFPISTNGCLLAEPPDNDEYWLRAFPIFQSIGGVDCRVNIPSFIEKLVVPDAHIFAAGSLHFGHWVADTLPFFLIQGSNLSNVPIFTTKLSAPAINTLKFFCNDKNKLLTELDMGREQLKCITFKNLYLYSNFGVRRKNNILRNCLRSIPKIDFSSTPKRAPKICYLRRGIVDGVGRLQNENEIVKYLDTRNIQLVDLRDHPFETSQSFFHQFDIFIMLNSSANTNFNVYGKDGAHLITFVPSQYSQASIDVVLASAMYLVPRVQDVTPAYALTDEIHPTLADPVHIPLGVLSDRLDQALESWGLGRV